MALKSAGVEWKQIEAAFVSNARFPVAVGHITLTPLGRTGISIIDTRAACASGVTAMQQGYMAIASGMAELVLVLGMEKMPRGFLNPEGTYAPGWSPRVFRKTRFTGRSGRDGTWSYTARPVRSSAKYRLKPPQRQP